MKKIILLVSVVLFGCVGYAQAQTSEKKLSRQERKEPWSRHCLKKPNKP